ncbi:MAG: hypothetical protein K1X29_07530 [Bdellovibrionales bacterium]|nr:hypothetical protein [Bdellovibrionales bacterium]
MKNFRSLLALKLFLFIVWSSFANTVWDCAVLLPPPSSAESDLAKLLEWISIQEEPRSSTIIGNVRFQLEGTREEWVATSEIRGNLILRASILGGTPELVRSGLNLISQFVGGEYAWIHYIPTITVDIFGEQSQAPLSRPNFLPPWKNIKFIIKDVTPPKGNFGEFEIISEGAPSVRLSATVLVKSESSFFSNYIDFISISQLLVKILPLETTMNSEILDFITAIAKKLGYKSVTENRIGTTFGLFERLLGRLTLSPRDQNKTVRDPLNPGAVDLNFLFDLGDGDWEGVVQSSVHSRLELSDPEIQFIAALLVLQQRDLVFIHPNSSAVREWIDAGKKKIKFLNYPKGLIPREQFEQTWGLGKFNLVSDAVGSSGLEELVFSALTQFGYTYNKSEHRWITKP